jgi:hypothetical protein
MALDKTKCCLTFQLAHRLCVFERVSLIKTSSATFCICKHYTNIAVLTHKGHAAGGVVVEALRYKPEGRGFDSRWCHWNLSFI